MNQRDVDSLMERNAHSNPLYSEALLSALRVAADIINRPEVAPHVSEDERDIILDVANASIERPMKPQEGRSK